MQDFSRYVAIDFIYFVLFLCLFQTILENSETWNNI